MDEQHYAAVATIRLPLEPDEHGFRDTFNGPVRIVRFKTVPRVGEKVTFAGEVWLVTDVIYNLEECNEEQLAAGPANVRLELAAGNSDQAQHGVFVQLLYEDGSPDDEGVSVRFPALPAVGEFLYDCRRGNNTRYRVKQVNPILVPDRRFSGLFQVEYQVVVADAPEGESETATFRRPHPRFSDN